MYLLNYPISRFWQVSNYFWQVRTSPFCTTAVEIELCKSFLPDFAGTVKFVSKILWEWFGNGSLCSFGIVHDWNCLIGTLVICRGHLT